MSETVDEELREPHYVHHEVILDDETKQPSFTPMLYSEYDVKPLPKFESFLAHYHHFLDVIDDDGDQFPATHISPTSDEVQRAVDNISETPPVTGTGLMHQVLKLESSCSQWVEPTYSGVPVCPAPTYPVQYNYERITHLAEASADYGHPLMASTPAFLTPVGGRDFVSSTRSSFSAPLSLNSGGEETTPSSSSGSSSAPPAPPNTPASDWSSHSLLRPRQLGYLNVSPSVNCTSPNAHCYDIHTQHQIKRETDSNLSASSMPLKEWSCVIPNTATHVATSTPDPGGVGQGMAATRRSGSRLVTKAYHNEKERGRRSRVKNACNSLKVLIPGLGDKINRAALLELTVHYVRFVKHVLERDHGGASVNSAGGIHDISEQPQAGVQEDEADENLAPRLADLEGPESFVD